MTPTTLSAIRRYLFFSVKEAAKHIGGVTERSWHMWEAGKRTIPADVIETIGKMLQWREEALDAALKALQKAKLKIPGMAESKLEITCYTSQEAWACAEPNYPEMWRPHCSVVAELCAKHGVDVAPSA